jgi:hypothetical protein
MGDGNGVMSSLIEGAVELDAEPTVDLSASRSAASSLVMVEVCCWMGWMGMCAVLTCTITMQDA